MCVINFPDQPYHDHPIPKREREGGIERKKEGKKRRKKEGKERDTTVTSSLMSKQFNKWNTL